MAVTLSKIMQRALRECGLLVDIKAATGSSTTLIVDANATFGTDSARVGGTAFVVRDAGGAGAAPEGEFQRISAYASSSYTFTVDTAFSAAVAAGDTIGIAKPTITAMEMIEAVNGGLADLGYIDSLDTTLTYSSTASQYTLPVGLKSDNIKDVLIQTDATTYDWTSIRSYCRIETAAPGSTGLLYMRPIPYTGTTLKVIYSGYHAALTAYNSVLAECIPESLAVAAAIDKSLTWLVSKRGESALGSAVQQRWALAKQELQTKKFEQPVWHMKKANKWATF